MISCQINGYIHTVEYSLAIKRSNTDKKQQGVRMNLKHAEQKKLDTKEHILHGSVHVNLVQQMKSDLRLVIGGGCLRGVYISINISQTPSTLEMNLKTP